jgi:tetratricopeptide (TPR) repeat protein
MQTKPVIRPTTYLWLAVAIFACGLFAAGCDRGEPAPDSSGAPSSATEAADADRSTVPSNAGAPADAAVGPGPKASDAPSAGAADSGSAWVPPRVDLSAMPMRLQMRFGAARQLVTRSPDEVRPLTAFGAMCFVHADPQAAIACFERATRLKPDSDVTWYHLARASEKAGELDAARRAYERVLALNPDYLPVHVRLAGVLAAQGDSAAAAEHRAFVDARSGGEPIADTLDLMLRQQGLELEAVLETVQNQLEAGNTAAAQQLLELAVSLDESGARSRTAFGYLRGVQRRFDEAEREFQRALEAEPDYQPARVGLATTYLATQRRAEAEQLLEEVLAADPTNLSALDRLAGLRRQEAGPQGAVALYEAAVDAAGDRADVLFQLAEQAARREMPDVAMKALDRALAQNPELAVAHNLRGALLMSRSDYAGARAAWQAAIDAVPVYIEPRQRLAVLFLGMRQYEDAINVLREGIAQGRNSAPLLNTLAWILATCPEEDIRKPAEAVELAQRACELTQNRDHAALDTLAAAHAAAGNFAEARAAINRALVLVQAEHNLRLAREYVSRRAKYEINEPYIDYPPR